MLPTTAILYAALRRLRLATEFYIFIIPISLAYFSNDWSSNQSISNIHIKLAIAFEFHASLFLDRKLAILSGKIYYSRTVVQFHLR